MCSGDPARKWSTSDTLSAHDRHSLFGTTFSHDNIVKIVGNIRGDNVQTLADMLDRVSARAFRDWRTGWCSEPPPVKRFPCRASSSSTLTTGQQALFTGGSKYGTDPERQGGAVGLDEKYAWPHNNPKAMIQDPPSDVDLCCSVDQQGGQPNRRVSRSPSRRSTAGSGPSSMPADCQSSDLSKPQNNLGDCNSSRRDVTGKRSRKLPVGGFLLLLRSTQVSISTVTWVATKRESRGII